MKSVVKLVPSLLTLGNLACGFGAILADELILSLTLICISLVLDVFDGWAARVLNAQSDLGKELDSLADLVSFGVAPAFLYAKMVPFESTYFHIIFPSFIVLGSAWRLAKFNLLPSSKYFIGLPTPASAIFMLGILYAFDQNSPLITEILKSKVGYAAIPIVLAFVMNSPLKMFSLKSISNHWEDNTGHIAVVILTLLILIYDTTLAISGSILSFILVSIILIFIHPNSKDKVGQ